MSFFDFLKRGRQSENLSDRRSGDSDSKAKFVINGNETVSNQDIENDIFALVHQVIPNLLKDPAYSDGFTNGLLMEKGNMLVKLLDLPHKDEKGYSSPYAAEHFSVRAISLFSDADKQVKFVLTQIIMPELPEPRNKMTSCSRAYICYDRESKISRFFTVETNKLLPDTVLCESRGDTHAMFGVISPDSEAQDIIEILKVLGHPDYRQV